MTQLTAVTNWHRDTFGAATLTDHGRVTFAAVERNGRAAARPTRTGLVALPRCHVLNGDMRRFHAAERGFFATTDPLAGAHVVVRSTATRP